MIPKTVIEVGKVGVVVSYTGAGRRGHLRRGLPPWRTGEHGSRGVWNEPLLPGKYAFNTYAGKVVHGADDQLHPEVDARRRPARTSFDENLSEVA